MGYKIALHTKAAEFIKKLDSPTKERIKERIKQKLKELEQQPELGKHLKHSKFWSLRIGDYRAIYEINQEQKTCIVLFTGHRKNVYENFDKLF